MKIDKELRIGDVIQLDNDWYQCVECKKLSCKECDLMSNEYVCKVETPHCRDMERSDNKEVFYKKLEKIGEPIEYNQGRMFQNLKSIDGHTCTNCDFIDIEGACHLENCSDCFYKEIKGIKKMKKNMEIKSIVVPDGWECIVKNGIATFQEKKENTQNLPRSWEEFSKCNPVKVGEAFINYHTEDCDPITEADYCVGKERKHINWCTSRGEAEAFLALMQLRQLRKAWVGDWDFVASPLLSCHAIVYTKNSGLRVRETSSNHPMSFPTTNIAEDFFNCFKELLEKAKIIL